MALENVSPPRPGLLVAVLAQIHTCECNRISEQHAHILMSNILFPYPKKKNKQTYIQTNILKPCIFISFYNPPTITYNLYAIACYVCDKQKKCVWWRDECEKINNRLCVAKKRVWWKIARGKQKHARGKQTKMRVTIKCVWQTKKCVWWRDWMQKHK